MPSWPGGGWSSAVSRRTIIGAVSNKTTHSCTTPICDSGFGFSGRASSLPRAGGAASWSTASASRGRATGGAAIEPIVRASLERILPDPRLGAARFVGGYWTRDHRVEVDLVGGADRDRADPVEFVGSIKWREAASFDRADVARLIGHRDRVPGGTERSILVGVSRSGFETGDLDVALEPSDILDAWR